MARKGRDNDWKKRLGVVYSTSNEYRYDVSSDNEKQTVSERDQRLIVQLDKKQRRGKQVTLVSGFIGSAEDIKELSKFLKSKCGVGGSTKDGEIIIQGDHRRKVQDLLSQKGYNIQLK